MGYLNSNLEKRAANAHDLIRYLRTAAVKSNIEGSSKKLDRAWELLGKRNQAVNKVRDARLKSALDADDTFGRAVDFMGKDHIGALIDGGAGRLPEPLQALFNERARLNNRIPTDAFMYEKSPVGVIKSLDDLKRMENMAYPVKSAY